MGARVEMAESSREDGADDHVIRQANSESVWEAGQEHSLPRRSRKNGIEFRHRFDHISTMR